MKTQLWLKVVLYSNKLSIKLKLEVYDKEIMTETSCFNHLKQKNVVHEAINRLKKCLWIRGRDLYHPSERPYNEMENETLLQIELFFNDIRQRGTDRSRVNREQNSLLWCR